MMRPEEMPDPAALIDYGDGGLCAAMFHYAAEGSSFEDIANWNGFEVQFECLDEDDPLWADYQEGAGDIPARWRPEPPEGWTLGGVTDTEDGPLAMYLRPAAEPSETESELAEADLGR